MNVFDALLFFNLALLSFLFGSDTSVPTIARLLLAAPIVFIVALVILKNMHRHIIHCWNCFKLHFCWMYFICSMRQLLLCPLTSKQMQQTRISTSTATQTLIQPGSSIEISCSYDSYQWQMLFPEMIQGVDGVASYSPFFIQGTMGTGVSLLASHPPPLFSIVKYR